MSDIYSRQDFIPDRRDWDAWRDRMLAIEERMLNAENQLVANDIRIKNLTEEARVLRGMVLDVQRQFALFMQGSKERFDVLSLLLERTQSALAGKDVE